MQHTPNPIYESKSGRTTLSLVFTILITGGLFLIIPLTQLSSQLISSCPPPNKTGTIVTPPPKYEPPPIPEKNPETLEEKITLKLDFDPISIRDMVFLFHVTAGEGIKRMVGTFDSDNFPIADPVFDQDQVDVPPRALIQPTPAYPQALKRAEIEGKVSVQFIVSSNGSIRNISIKNATHREFATSVRDALRRASFEPGKIDNKPVTTRVRQVFNFNLRK